MIKNIIKVPEIGLGRSSDRFQEWQFNLSRSVRTCTELDTRRLAGVEQVQTEMLACETELSCERRTAQEELKPVRKLIRLADETRDTSPQ